MRENLLAGVVAAAAIVPLCATCILGPALVASFFTGIAAWFGGLDPVVTAILVLVAGLTVYGFIRKRRERQILPAPGKEVRQ